MEMFICIHIDDYNSVLVVRVLSKSQLEASISFNQYLKDKGYMIDECSNIRIRPLSSMEEI